MRSVCGCMPTISAATEIMYLGRSALSGPRLPPEGRDRSRPYGWGDRERSRERTLPRVLAGDLLQILDRLALGLRQLRRDGDTEAREQVAPPGAVQLRRTLAADTQELAVLRPRRH